MWQTMTKCLTPSHHTHIHLIQPPNLHPFNPLHSQTQTLCLSYILQQSSFLSFCMMCASHTATPTSLLKKQSPNPKLLLFTTFSFYVHYFFIVFSLNDGFLFLHLPMSDIAEQQAKCEHDFQVHTFRPFTRCNLCGFVFPLAPSFFSSFFTSVFFRGVLMGLIRQGFFCSSLFHFFFIHSSHVVTHTSTFSRMSICCA